MTMVAWLLALQGVFGAFDRALRGQQWWGMRR